MTLILSLIAVVAPVVTSSLTNLFKKLPTFASLSDASRTPGIRLLAALISLIAVLLAEWMAGSFDANILVVAIQTVLLTAATWFASLGIFHSTKPA